MFSKINFGSVEGKGDRELDNYFLDNGYLDEIKKYKKFFILGRKGTGKSAIFWYLFNQQGKHGYLCENLKLSDFPVNMVSKIMNSNTGFVNKYYSIWEYIVLLEIGRLIVKNENINANDNSYKKIKKYIDHIYKDDPFEHHKVNVNVIQNKDGKVKVPVVNVGASTKTEYTIEDSAIDMIEKVTASLKRIVKKYLKGKFRSEKYYIQFDGLDEAYSGSNMDDYLELIKGLFEVSWDLNREFDNEILPVQINVFLRSDIYDKMHILDSNSGKWDENQILLSWAAYNNNDYLNGGLRKLIEKRITSSFEVDDNNPWDFAVKNISKIIGSKRYVNGGKKYEVAKDSFKYLVQRTMHRPRDIVQFSKKIQESIRKNGVNQRAFEEASKKYSQWFWKELRNEVNQDFKNTEQLLNFIKYMGNRMYTYKEFEGVYNNFIDKEGSFDMNFAGFSSLLYKYGFLSNYKRGYGYISIIREENSTLKRTEKLKLNECIINMVKFI